MKRATYDTGEMRLLPRMEKWVRTDDLHYLSIAISDAAFMAACDGARGEIELRRVDRLIDARVGALVAATNAERVTGFPSGRFWSPLSRPLRWLWFRAIYSGVPRRGNTEKD